MALVEIEDHGETVRIWLECTAGRLAAAPSVSCNKFRLHIGSFFGNTHEVEPCLTARGCATISPA